MVHIGSLPMEVSQHLCYSRKIGFPWYARRPVRRADGSWWRKGEMCLRCPGASWTCWMHPETFYTHMRLHLAVLLPEILLAVTSPSIFIQFYGPAMYRELSQEPWGCIHLGAGFLSQNHLKQSAHLGDEGAGQPGLCCAWLTPRCFAKGCEGMRFISDCGFLAGWKVESTWWDNIVLVVSWERKGQPGQPRWSCFSQLFQVQH